jgi:hypothetical protein
MDIVVHIVVGVVMGIEMSIVTMVKAMDGISFLLKQLLHVESVHGEVIICTAGSHKPQSEHQKRFGKHLKDSQSII